MTRKKTRHLARLLLTWVITSDHSDNIDHGHNLQPE